MMILKFNYYDSRKTYTAIISSENKFSSASIGASFTPSGLTDISISANKANGNSKESVTSYSPALVSAKNDLSLSSGKDMDIISGARHRARRSRQRSAGISRLRPCRRKKPTRKTTTPPALVFRGTSTSLIKPPINLLRQVLKMPIVNFPCPTSEVPSVKEISTPTIAVHAIRQDSSQEAKALIST